MSDIAPVAPTPPPLAAHDEPSRARRFKAQTHAVHERLDNGLSRREGFSTLTGYTRFVAMQRAFHRDIAPLYASKALQALIPGLAARQRLDAVEADAADLGLGDGALAPGRDAPFPSGDPIDIARALGWLYVAEGSNMGAAVLRKAVTAIGMSDQHGARHLAPAPQGPAAHWRAFVAALDAVDLDDAAETRAVSGAREAFAHVEELADAAWS